MASKAERITLVPLDSPVIEELSTNTTDPQLMGEDEFLVYGLTDESDDFWVPIKPVEDVLGSLTPRQRQILWLRFHPNKDGQLPTLKEIGKKVFYSPSTVGRELQVALEKIPDPSKLYFPQR